MSEFQAPLAATSELVSGTLILLSRIRAAIPSGRSSVKPEHPHNFAWGDEDGRMLHMTARTGLYRIRPRVPGIRP